MRKIEIKNDKILKGLKDKEEVVKRIREITATMAELEKEYNTLVAKVSRVDEKVRPHINKENQKIEKEEFEQLSRVIIDKEALIFEVADRLEEFKANYKKAIEEAK